MKNKRCNVRLSGRDYALLKQKAQEKGITRAALLREYINRPEPSWDGCTSAIKELTRFIDEHGDLINEIAARANCGSFIKADLHAVRTCQRELILKG